MLTEYFQSRHALERMRGGRLGPYLDDFTDTMAKDGFDQAFGLLALVCFHDARRDARLDADVIGAGADHTP